jgi:hypothetical protein
VCWRCGEPIPPGAAADLGHVDEEGRERGLPVRYPEHRRCNRRTLSHLVEKHGSLAAAAAGSRPNSERVGNLPQPKVDRFDGLPDPDPGNSADRWSRHWYGGFNPRCPDCRERGAACEAAGRFTAAAA